jgi:hypothetical protein
MKKHTLFLAILLAALIGNFSSSVAGDQDFTLVNRTGVTLWKVYVSAANTNNWEEDVLGGDILLSGQRLRCGQTLNENQPSKQ